MSFSERTNTAAAIVERLKEFYWERAEIRATGVLHADYGYETHTTDDVRAALIPLKSVTAKHIRFTPDSMIIKRQVKVELLEYKVTRTPRYTLLDNQWGSGQIEADAWDNYDNLRKADVIVCVLIYCPYHHRPLLCDYPADGWLTQRRTQVQASVGSGTPYVNIDLAKMRTFHQFMADEYGVPVALTQQLLSATFWRSLRDDTRVQVQHGANSGYKNRKTAFNWDAELCHGVSDTNS